MPPNLQGRRVLVVDDHDGLRRMLVDVLARLGADVDGASGGGEALRKLEASAFDLVLLDLRMDDMTGLDVLAAVGHAETNRRFIMMSAEGTVPAAVEAVRRGASDFLMKPFELDVLFESISRVLGLVTGPAAAADPRAEWRDRHAPEIVGMHPRLLEVFFLLERIAPSDTTVLVLGESGTGKELIARALHSASPRHKGPFVPVNCGAIPETLIESELFGHARGAFSGAVAAREGRFAASHRGTLFLDEVGEMSPNVQVKFLRVLQEGEFVPVGETKARSADVRVVAATHRDLEQMVTDGRFREDLFYRLALIPIQIPPLRQRASDIPLLAAHFLRHLAERRGLPALTVGDDALDVMQRYPWPGNVRELENTIERMALLHTGSGTLRMNELPDKIRRVAQVAESADGSGTRVSPFVGRVVSRPDTLRTASHDATVSFDGRPATRPIPPPAALRHDGGGDPEETRDDMASAGAPDPRSGSVRSTTTVQAGLATGRALQASRTGDGETDVQAPGRPAPGTHASAADVEADPLESRAGVAAEPASDTGTSWPAAPTLPAEGCDLRRAVEAFEQSLIEQALARTGGNKLQAAKLLSLNRTTLVEKLKKYGRS